MTFTITLDAADADDLANQLRGDATHDDPTPGTPTHPATTPDPAPTTGDPAYDQAFNDIADGIFGDVEYSPLHADDDDTF